MDKSKAIELLKQALGEIPQLRQLRYDAQEPRLWHDRVRNIIDAALETSDVRTFSPIITSFKMRGIFSDEVYQQEYLKKLNQDEIALKSIIQKYEILGIPETSESITAVADKPKVFISHGKDEEALLKLERFLNELGVQPIIVKDQPNLDRTVDRKVEDCLTEADFVIILGTADDEELKDGKLYPRRNVHIEIGRFQERFPNRIIYLLEEGASFPSDISEKLYTRFTQESMDKTFITVARELTAFGILKAAKS